MEFNFESREKKTHITVYTSEKYFYQVTSSCSLIFLHTDGEILMDIEDKNIKKFLENLVSKKNAISEPVIGDTFALDITREKIGIDKLVFFYIEGSINETEKGSMYENFTDDLKSKLRKAVIQKYGLKITKKDADILSGSLWDQKYLPSEKVNKNFIDVLNNNTNGSLSIQFMTVSAGVFRDPKDIYNAIIEELLLESQSHNITSVYLCCGGEWRRYVETNEFVQEFAFEEDYDDYEIVGWTDSYLGYAVQVDNLQAELRFKDNLIDKLQVENKGNHYPIDYTNHIIESESDPTLEIMSLNSCLEIVSKYMGQIFLADYIKSGKEDQSLNKGINKILKRGHLTIGTWAKICNMISESHEKEISKPYMLHELAELIPRKNFQDVFGNITKMRNTVAHSFNPNLEGKIETGDYREKIITYINMIKAALVKTKLIYINEKAAIENDGKTYETKFQVLEGLYPRKNKIGTDQHLLHKQLYITDEKNEKFVGLHPFMKYEVSSDSKKTEFYTIKQIIQSTFVYDGISFGEGTELEIDIDTII